MNSVTSDLSLKGACLARHLGAPRLPVASLKGLERAGAQACSHVVSSWPELPIPGQRLQTEGLLTGNYEVKPEDMTTATTWPGPGYGSKPMRGHGEAPGEPPSREQGPS